MVQRFLGMVDPEICAVAIVEPMTVSHLLNGVTLPSPVSGLMCRTGGYRCCTSHAFCALMNFIGGNSDLAAMLHCLLHLTQLAGPRTDVVTDRMFVVLSNAAVWPSAPVKHTADR